MRSDEVRWELGERVLRDGLYVPGAFVVVYAAVLGWKRLVKALTPAPSERPALLALPPPQRLLPPPRDEER